MASQSVESVARAMPPEVSPKRPGWLKSRNSQAAPAAAGDSNPATNSAQGPEPAPTAVAERVKPHYPKTLAGWVAMLWHGIVQWWTNLYCGWGVITSLAIHSLVVVALALTYFSIQEERGFIVGGSFDEVTEGEALEELLDSRLDTSFGDNSASLEFVATSAVADIALMESMENVLGGSDGTGSDVGDSAAEMARSIKVPESAVTKGSFTVWTEPENPRPREPYDIVIQVQLPSSARQYRLTDLSGSVRGTDGYLKLIKYGSRDRKTVKDGTIQVLVRIPGAAQLVRDVIEIRSRLLNEEQTIEIIFGGKGSRDSL